MKTLIKITAAVLIGALSTVSFAEEVTLSDAEYSFLSHMVRQLHTERFDSNVYTAIEDHCSTAMAKEHRDGMTVSQTKALYACFTKNEK